MLRASTDSTLGWLGVELYQFSILEVLFVEHIVSVAKTYIHYKL
jgi:hypothetical protein